MFGWFFDIWYFTTGQFQIVMLKMVLVITVLVWCNKHTCVKGTKGLKYRCTGWIILGGHVCEAVACCTELFGSTGSHVLCVLMVGLLYLQYVCSHYMLRLRLVHCTIYSRKYDIQ